MSRPITKVRFRLTRARDYRMLAANGAHGGTTANGDVVVDFYVERAAVPEAQILHVEEGELVGQEEAVPWERGERVIDREAQVGLLLTPASARAIGLWLIDQAERADPLLSEDAEIGGEHAADEN